MNNSVQSAFPLSYGQQALWYLHQIDPRSTAYHLGVALKMTGRLDERALDAAWADIAMAHPQLRARFQLRDGQPCGWIDPTPARLRIESGGAADLNRFWNIFAGSPFALEREAPARALLLRDGNRSSHLLLCMHHIVGDLWSAAILLRELRTNYEARVSGRVPLRLREAMTFGEFAASESRWLIGPQGRAAWDFWRRYLDGVKTAPFVTPSVANEKAGDISIVLDTEATALVLRAARERKTTPYTILVASYARLLGEETGLNEIIVGTAATLRNCAALRNTVGYLVNTVPVRCPVAKSFEDEHSATITNARDALSRRRFPFSALVERLGVERVAGMPPLIHSMFAYQSLPHEDRGLLPLAFGAAGHRWEFASGIEAETVATPPFDAQFPIALTLARCDQEFNGRLQFDGRCVNAAKAMRLADRFPKLVREFLGSKKPKQRRVLVEERGERLEQLFDNTAARQPDGIVMSEGGIELTYAQVKSRTDALAAKLDAALTDLSGPVALQMPPCGEASICILAILKSGRAFQPIDPTEPPSRRNAALVRTGACALLSPSGVDTGTLPDGVLALHPEGLKSFSATRFQLKKPSSTAYFISTSGTTGDPKVVEVGHASVINHARAMARLFELTPGDRVLQFHTLAFDAAFEELFPSWFAGAQVIHEPEARHFSIPTFLEMVSRRGIAVLNLPTSYWHTLTSEAARMKWRPGPHLRLLVVGGERASENVYANWRKLAPRCRWINTYGPTETTITALSYEAPTGAAINGALPIGRPIDGITAFVLNQAGEATRAGELYLGGKGLALGYKGDPKATVAKFVRRNIAGKDWALYRTGDRVKVRADGNFEFLGRMDRQVKIRGYRIDPEEIERALLAHPEILDVAVMPENFRDELRLSAWIQRINGSPSDAELRAFLGGRVPAHMIPSQLTFVSRIPRKLSGKVDALALTKPSRHPVEARSRGMQELTAIFSELLGDRIDPGDNFFSAGGHSLLAIKLLGQIESRYGRRLSVSDFLEAPTAKALWKKLRAGEPGAATITGERIPIETPLSAQQQRALTAHEAGYPSLANIVLDCGIRGRIDDKRLASALEAAARRHFLIRSGFFKTSAGIVLRDTGKFPTLERVVVRDRDFDRAATSLVRSEGDKTFTVDGENPWMRLLLITGNKIENSRLVLITHHAVADGWALGLLFNELVGNYANAAHGSRALQAPGKDYRNYALQQARWLRSAEAHAQADFWKHKLVGAQLAHLPFRQNIADKSWRIQRHEIYISPALGRNLRTSAASFGTTFFALAMACFKAQLHRYDGQTDILLGTAVSNRSTEGNQNVFGPLQNPALIRDEVTSRLRMRDLARRVAHSLTEAEANGALPFEHVIRNALPHLPSTGLHGGIQFLSHDHTAGKLRFGKASVHLMETPAEESPFELSLAVSTASPGVRVVFEYQPTAYPEAGIKRLAQQYLAVLKSVTVNPNVKVGELNVMPVDEQRTLTRRVHKIHSPRAELLHEGFEAQVRNNPEAVAIASKTRSLTYGELNAMAESMAAALIEGGLKPGGLVAVILAKGWEQIVACLAILKAGGAYVPADPTLPESRLHSIFTQGKFHAAVVTNANVCKETWAAHFRSILTIESRANSEPRSTRIRVKPDALAYVIFTSGSTGIPKGVKVAHQAAMTTIAEMNRRFQIQSRDRVLAVSALGFDLSVFDIFATLRSGGTIVIPASQDPREWLDRIVAEKVTVWNSAPCVFSLLLDEAAVRHVEFEALRLILLSGDFIGVALAQRTRTLLPRAQLVSLGGATEGGIWSIAHEIKEVNPAWRGVPYGRSLKHQEMFVLDHSLDHCPTGVTGELFIAGAALANGYWRNRKETKHRFLIHPRWRIRLYRTGDQGRYLVNGEIEILGRVDGQVKVNGVRFELGEVEAALGALPSVRHAVAELRTDAVGNKRIVAFVAAESGTTPAALIAHVQKFLPAVAIPTACVVLDRLPLTPNGKVDRAALRAMSLPISTSSAMRPENPVEQWIAELWSELLGGATFSTEDDFFAVGGYSLVAVQMLQRVRAHFKVDLPLALVIERPTVRGLAAAIAKARQHSEFTGLPRRDTCELERDTNPILSARLPRLSQQPDAILLTGATGHLGSALLADLLRHTDDRVYCLVRAGSKREAEARVIKALQPQEFSASVRRRIIAIPADLSRERFGWSISAFIDLAKGIRAAYHCAAEVNFLAPYQKLAATNVNGVREMIRLVSQSGATLHHVSSVAVFPYGGGRIRGEEEDITRIATLAGGYAQSKWASERMVWKAISQGLRAVIYRPAQIIGGKKSGAPRDLFEHVMRACVALGAVPDIEAEIDLVTSDYAAAAIRWLSNQKNSLGKAFHLVHPEPLPLRDFVQLLPHPLPVVPLESWLEILREKSASTEDRSLSFVSLLAQGLRREDLTPPRFDSSNTVAGLRNSKLTCPALDQQFIKTNIAASEPASGNYHQKPNGKLVRHVQPLISNLFQAT